MKAMLFVYADYLEFSGVTTTGRIKNEFQNTIDCLKTWAENTKTQGPRAECGPWGA